MTDNIWLALIIVVVIIAALIVFRNQLRRFIVKINREGIDTELATHIPGAAGEAPAATAPAQPSAPGVRISSNILRGQDQSIDVRNTDIAVNKNRLIGRDQRITVVTPDPHVVHLHQHITNNFSLNDFRTLCLALNIDPAALSGPVLLDQTTVLLTQLQAQDRLSELIAAARHIRPDLDWED